MSSFLAASTRSRSSRSSSFISLGLSIRNGISSPSTVAVRVASSSATRSASSLDEVAEVARARELPQLAAAAVPVDRGSERERRIELRQALVPLVDRRDVVRLLEAREVEVGLLVELRDEAVGVRAERVDLPLLERLRHAGS